LQKADEPLEAIGELSGDQIEIDAAALLEVGELRDFEAVEHDLPADAPGSERRGLPVVLFKLDVVLAEIDADGFQALQIKIEHIGGRRLQDDLKLLVLVEAVRILAIAAVGGAAARLNVGDAVRIGAEHAEKGLGTHRAGPHFHVVGLLNHAAPVGPELFEFEDRLLE
jgi:hypothetical protein